MTCLLPHEHVKNWIWPCAPIIPKLGRQRLEDSWDLQASPSDKLWVRWHNLPQYIRLRAIEEDCDCPLLTAHACAGTHRHTHVHTLPHMSTYTWTHRHHTSTHNLLSKQTWLFSACLKGHIYVYTFYRWDVATNTVKMEASLLLVSEIGWVIGRMKVYGQGEVSIDAPMLRGA